MTGRAGLFEAADRGTLFLDEVGELSTRAQAKLLRALQDGEIRRVGENLPRRVDVRVVAATNRPLEADVSTGRFREDLLYRVDVLRIVVPPLRDRDDDVLLLAEHFWRRAQSVTGSRAAPARSMLAALARYHWPGNVRQLENVIASLVVRGPRHGAVGPSTLPGFIAGDADEVETLQQARVLFERRYVSGALARAGGRRGKAALALGVTRQGLAKLLGSSQRSVQLRPVYMANKSSINSDLRGWRTPSVSGEELQTPGVRPTGDGGIARGLPVPRG